MRVLSRLMASATLGGLVLLLVCSDAGAQTATPNPEVGRAVAAVGSIHGIVRDETGAPVPGALISAFGTTRAFARADRSGRFEVGPLSPGSYFVRAHFAGFTTPRGQMIEVSAGGRTSWSVAMRRETPNPGSSPVLTAGLAIPPVAVDSGTQLDEPDDKGSASVPEPKPASDDHSERAWRLRHLRRGVLQDASGLQTLIDDELAAIDEASLLASTPAASNTHSTNLFAATPLFGQFNLLTTSSFDDPRQLFSSDNIPRSVAYVSVGAPVGSHAMWAVRGALTQADLSSWVVAGSYATQGDATHRYNVGLSYATQRYDGGNPAALRDVTDGSRNAGTLYAFDTFTITPVLSVTYGARYARYDYLENQTLISPRVGVTISPAKGFRINGLVSRRATAPGAEEFLPPSDDGIWLPPQRTFSSLAAGRLFDAERTTHAELEIERDVASTSTMSIRVFRQQVDDQLVTMFGLDVPGVPPANLGHYFVGNYGNLGARGVGAGLRTTIAKRVNGSIEYSMTQTEWDPGSDPEHWSDRLPSSLPLRSGRIHDVATAFETNIPETSTRVVVLYRVSNAFARRKGDDDSLLDSRFDVQLRQSLPFLDFSTAKWEMLIGVRNFFRETAADQSVYDELLVIRPPKRIVGGLTMRF